ncbi:hypothetical protein [Mycolicibacterium sp. CBMA 361]|uniref:hypothetical protein n=1 Tax=Mycolicibacterium sp. CBMA 361 TaxID=2606610 RepID=UPI001EF00B75|nr:hypothetical protein [Mycolicibacterium sp. CBMA 361]
MKVIGQQHFDQLSRLINSLTEGSTAMIAHGLKYAFGSKDVCQRSIEAFDPHSFYLFGVGERCGCGSWSDPMSAGWSRLECFRISSGRSGRSRCRPRRLSLWRLSPPRS